MILSKKLVKTATGAKIVTVTESEQDVSSAYLTSQKVSLQQQIADRENEITSIEATEQFISTHNVGDEEILPI